MEKNKVVTLEDRIPKIREMRKQKANRRLVLSLSLFFILLSFIIYSQSSLSKVSSISVQGQQYVESETIVKVSEIKEGTTSFFQVKKADVESRIEELQEIKSATVKKELPNSIHIDSEEYKRIAYILNNGTYTPVIENGDILSSSTIDILPHDAALMIGWNNKVKVDEFINELMKLPESVIYAISEAHFTPNETDPNHITLFMNDGFEVSGTIHNFASKMASYPSIIAQLDPEQKGVINIEVGVFFKPYDVEVDGDEVEDEG